MLANEKHYSQYFNTGVYNNKKKWQLFDKKDHSLVCEQSMALLFQMVENSGITSWVDTLVGSFHRWRNQDTTMIICLSMTT